MKAVIHRSYGRPALLEFGEVDLPAIEDHQVLIRVRASSVNPSEWYSVTGPYFARMGNGLRRPKTTPVGADCSGQVEAVGRKVSDLKPGDEVFGAAAGAWAEFVAARPDRLVSKPAGVTFDQAAAVPVAGLTALQALRDKGL